jgi:hypothetical protein
MAKSISHAHHYVPQWYQKRFAIAGQEKLWRLDLRPETVKIDETRSFTRKALVKLYPVQCFYKDDLYLLRFGTHVTDAMERVFFGAVDKSGCNSAAFFEAFDVKAKGLRDSYNGLLAYLAAQRFRTPRGLDWIKRQWGTKDQNQTLMALQNYYQAYNAMLVEGIWEVAHARHSPTKFIISDNPVTFFNRKVYPSEQVYPGGDHFPTIGTRTIFPLSTESCLIITHLELARNPWADPSKLRENARMFGNSIARLTEVQYGRSLEEGEVLRLNYMLKQHANRYIASAKKEDLYPEQHFGRIDWAKLDDDWFLFPNLWKVGFTTGIMLGGKGWGHSIDEYGRDPSHPKFKDPRRRDNEHQTFENGKQEWAKKRVGKSIAKTWKSDREDSVDEEMMREYLQSEGLLP